MAAEYVLLSGVANAECRFDIVSVCLAGACGRASKWSRAPSTRAQVDPSQRGATRGSSSDAVRWVRSLPVSVHDSPGCGRPSSGPTVPSIPLVPSSSGPCATLRVVVRASGNNSVVECDLAKVEVAGSNPVSRSNFSRLALPGIPLRSSWRRSQVVRQRSAKPPSPVQIRAAPPILNSVNTVTCGRCVFEPSRQLRVHFGPKRRTIALRPPRWPCGATHRRRACRC